jgi:hypothetical protein
LLQYRLTFYNKRYSWQYNILPCNDLDFCCNIAQPFVTNDKFMATEHICGNIIKYIATILSFVSVTVRSCNKSQYYSNKKKFIVENLFLATNLVACDNKFFCANTNILQPFISLVVITHSYYNKKFHVAVESVAKD